MQNIQEALNEAQWEAVSYCDGPALVIAGAGSGKTRVLTYKIAYLLQRGVDPRQILSLTFTNKAAREMNARIAQLTGSGITRFMWSGTFHSIFARLLRIEAKQLDYTSDFTIYDASDSRSLVKTILKEMGLDDKVYKPNVVAARISEAKNALVLPAQYQADAEVARRDKLDGIPQTGQVYAAYCQRCRQANAMDFDDLLLNTFLLFDRFLDVRQKYAQRFRYILVDEYQDTNAAQHRILSQLTTADSPICVVGDDAQSIYAFRGARIDNILQFQQQYPGARLIKLERNYRSTQTIVNAANSVIRHNRYQIPKEVYSRGTKGAPIRVIATGSDKEESLQVAAEVTRLHRREGLELNEIVLLYRTNAQSRSFEETFRGAGIPYRVYGGLSFYQRKEIRDVIAYFRLVCNPHDEEAFKRIVNYPARGIGATSQAKLAAAAAGGGVTLWEVACAPEQYGAALSRAAQSRLQAFCEQIAAWQSQLSTESGYDLALRIVHESGIAADLSGDDSPEMQSKRENVEELLGSIKAAEDERREEEGDVVVPLTEFLSQVALLTDADERDDDTPKVSLMTVHAAKGLEFAAVFVTGMEDDLFPSSSARYNPREMEEERRLFYVAITRAKTYCYLSYARTRYRYGNMEFCMPSPFIDEVGAEFLEREQPALASRPVAVSPMWLTRKEPRIITRPSKAPASSPSSSRSAVSAGGGLAVGQTVEHTRFGVGTVLSLEGEGDNLKATIDFKYAGQKKLLVKFAKLRVQ